METFVSSSQRRRSRRKKKISRSTPRYLGISKPVMRKRNNKNVKKIKQFMGSLIEGSCELRFSSNPNCETHLTGSNRQGKNIFERTIDLSDGESSVNSSRSGVFVVPSSEVQRLNDVIDLSKDPADENEIIDLTHAETISMARSCCNANSTTEPTVIDITEDDLGDQSSCKLENNEICVIGTFNKNPYMSEKDETLSSTPLSNKLNNFSNLSSFCDKKKKKYLMKQSVFNKINNKSMNELREFLRKPRGNLTEIGENVYINSSVTFPSNGLRPIIIDGSNVAFVHSNSNFSCKRLEICINYFKEKGHSVIAFVPQYRMNNHRSDNPKLLKRLERQGDVILTPSKKVDGRNIVPYDDRFIVQTAVLKGGIIVSRDNYNDLLRENPAWADTIKYRTLAFTWVGDVLMFPKDPLGEYGPSLEEFLRFQ